MVYDKYEDAGYEMGAAVFHVLGDGDGLGPDGRGLVWKGGEDEMSEEEVRVLHDAGTEPGGLCYEARNGETPELVSRR